MTPAAIVSHVVTTTQAARDYAVIMSEPDAEVRGCMFDMHAFEIAKDVANAHTATRHPKRVTAWSGLYASLVIVEGDREIEVVVNVMTRKGSVHRDERDQRRSA
jgi:hypothetical protein